MRKRIFFCLLVLFLAITPICLKPAPCQAADTKICEKISTPVRNLFLGLYLRLKLNDARLSGRIAS